jgi:hypothetical protein
MNTLNSVSKKSGAKHREEAARSGARRAVLSSTLPGIRSIASEHTVAQLAPPLSTVNPKSFTNLLDEYTGLTRATN